MTPQCGVRAAMTEERSKAEIKTSALRRSDETKSCYPHQTKGSTQQRAVFFLSRQKN